MSIQSILVPNSYGLFCDTLTTNGIVDASQVNTTEVTPYAPNPIKLFTSTNVDTGLSLALKYNYTGVATIFYDQVSALSTLDLSAIPYIQFGTAANNYSLTGFPNPRGQVPSPPNSGQIYSQVIYMYLQHTGVGDPLTNIPAKLILEKLSESQVSIKIYPFDPNISSTPHTAPSFTGKVGFSGFTFDYIVD